MHPRHPGALDEAAVSSFVDGIYRAWRNRGPSGRSSTCDRPRVRAVQRFWAGYLADEEAAAAETLTREATFEFLLPEGHELAGEVVGPAEVFGRLDLHFSRIGDYAFRIDTVDVTDFAVELRGSADGRFTGSGRQFAIRSWHQYRFRDDLIDAIVMRPTKLSDLRAFSEAGGGGSP